jgi:uncharacterized protein involved in response to NO
MAAREPIGGRRSRRRAPFISPASNDGAVAPCWVERLTLGVAPLGLALNLVLPWSLASGLVALALALVQAMRLAGWYDRRAWGIPMLAVLYAGCLWLVLGFALDGLAGLGLVPPVPALHAPTAGAVGGFTLGMMARVALGHTGREMRSSTVTTHPLSQSLSGIALRSD